MQCSTCGCMYDLNSRRKSSWSRFLKYLPPVFFPLLQIFPLLLTAEHSCYRFVSVITSISVIITITLLYFRYHQSIKSNTKWMAYIAGHHRLKKSGIVYQYKFNIIKIIYFKFNIIIIMISIENLLLPPIIIWCRCSWLVKIHVVLSF